LARKKQETPPAGTPKCHNFSLQKIIRKSPRNPLFPLKNVRENFPVFLKTAIKAFPLLKFF